MGELAVAKCAGGCTLSFGHMMKIAISIVLFLVGGCASSRRVSESSIEAFLNQGDYRSAILEIEGSRRSPEWTFALGLLYAYREIEESGASADFSKTLSLVREAAPNVEEAKGLICEYELNGERVFFGIPWAHVIGPDRDYKRPQLK